jgi:MYXO-CTERM domain-containing protein
MKKAATLIAALGLASAANAGLTLDDLSIGTLTGGSTVMGDTSGSSDDMNADVIGSGGSWSGGDDVYTLVWGGGDLVLDLLFSQNDGDMDLFLFDNNNPTGELAQGISVDDNEQVEVLGLGAGTYYVSVDGWLGASNTYTLNVSGVPAPSAMALLGLGGLVAGRRRR